MPIDTDCGFEVLHGKVGDSEAQISWESNDMSFVENEAVFNGPSVACVNPSNLLDLILFLIDLPNFNDSFCLVGNRILETPSAGDECLLGVHNRCIWVQSRMLFFNQETVLGQKIVEQNVSLSIQQHRIIIAKVKTRV